MQAVFRTLYHFGKMTLDVVEASIQRQQRSEELEQQAEAKGMLTSHSAVWAMVWAARTQAFGCFWTSMDILRLQTSLEIRCFLKG